MPSTWMQYFSLPPQVAVLSSAPRMQSGTPSQNLSNSKHVALSHCIIPEGHNRVAPE